MKFWKSASKSKRITDNKQAEGNNNSLEEELFDVSQRYSEEEMDIIFVYKGQSKKYYPKDFTHVTVHASMKKITKEAFQNSQSLYSIAIPPRVKTIQQSAFEDCNSLVLVELYEGLEAIEYAAFRSCRSLLGSMQQQNNDDRTVLVIPRTVVMIGHHAFFNCMSLTHVQFHQGLESIGRAAFSACRWLQKVDLPHGLKRIGNSAFCECKSLRTISVPATVDIIEDGAFQYCSSLCNVDLQEGLKSIEFAAFAGCSTLSAIALPSSLEKIGFRAFLDCTSLVGVEFPSDFSARFGEDCFAHCNSLVNVSLPASVPDAPTKVFAGCEMLPEHQTLQLRERFEYFSVHKTCYYSSVTTVYDLILALDSYDSKILKDKFGLTAFHIVATSAHPRVEILRCLLDKYPIEILEYSDKNGGRTMLDYLMMNSSSKVVPLIQLVLQRAIADKLSCWGLGEKWVSNLLGCLELMQSDYDIETRRKYVRDSFFGDVGYSMRLESTSLLEQALWKMRMGTVRKEESQVTDDYRQICRFQCGAGVVIGNVAEYLWNEDESKSDTALSVFRNIVPSLIR
mmetsp:Transcript_32930/g.79670  ORF Transcript_32930/g.79670 Transcript_32930/m.79670 type:complete len:566 (+) Transcript_32930:118-1815(+)